MDVTLGNALELALSAGVIGKELGGNPALNTRLREAVNFEKVLPAGEAPAEANRGTGATSAPAKFAAREAWRRREFVVIDGGAVLTAATGRALVSAAPLYIVTIDGKRVGHWTASMA